MNWETEHPDIRSTSPIMEKNLTGLRHYCKPTGVRAQYRNGTGCSGVRNVMGELFTLLDAVDR